MKNNSTAASYNRYSTLFENERFDPRTLKRQELIKISYEYGLKFSKKTKNKVFIEFLTKIHRKLLLQKNVDQGLQDCPICLDTLEKTNTIMTKCIHAFCKKCIFSYIVLEKEMCPFCRETYTYEHLVKELDEKEVDDYLNSITLHKECESLYSNIHPMFHRFFFNVFIFKKTFKIITYIVKYYFLYKSIEFLYLLLLQKDSKYTIPDYSYPMEYSDYNFTEYQPSVNFIRRLNI